MNKKVHVSAGHVGLVIRYGSIRRVLEAGEHRLRNKETLEEYDLSLAFNSAHNLDVLLGVEAVAKRLDVVEVADGEVVFHYAGNRLDTVLKPGRYAYWKGLVKHRFVRVDLSQVEIPTEFNIRNLQRPDVLTHVRSFHVESHEHALLVVDGELIRRLKPGTHYFWRNAITVEVLKVDTRTQVTEVCGQELLTKDKAAIRVNFDARYSVTDAHRALLENVHYTRQLYTALQLALREYVGCLTLDEMLERKSGIAEHILEGVADTAAKLGVKVTDAGIRDVILPGEVKEIMNSVLVAQKQAQANSIMRREETAATRSLLNTAKLMEDNAMLFRLKEMEYVEKIADKISTISISGGKQVLGQFRDLFVPDKTEHGE